MGQWNSDAYKGYVRKRYCGTYIFLFDPSGVAATRIWIVGHSIVHWDGARALESGLGAGLGFPHHVQVSWLARHGLQWGELLPLIRHRWSWDGRPEAIVVHLGGNDLPIMDCLPLRSTIQRDLGELMSLVHGSKLF